MASIEITNIPDDLHERLCQQAEKRNTTVDDLIMDAIERQVDRIEFHDRIRAMKQREFKVSPSELIAKERAQRDASFDI